MREGGEGRRGEGKGRGGGEGRRGQNIIHRPNNNANSYVLPSIQRKGF